MESKELLDRYESNRNGLSLNRDDAEEYTQALGQVVAGSWRQIALAFKLGVPEALGLERREWVEHRLGGYIRLSISERRDAVSELAAEGMSTREIGDVLGVGKSTVDRDLGVPNGTTGDDTQVQHEASDVPNGADSIDGPEPQVAEEPVKTESPEPSSGEFSPELPEPEPAPSQPPPEPDTPPLPEGRYRCIVIDPPWPVEKIERDARPNQGEYLDYYVWSVQEIRAKIGEYINEKAARDGCHVYLWVTHRFLPDAFRLFEAWGVRYQCLMTWRKNVGITPYSWMYDTEHVLFGRIGGLQVQELGLRLSFDASVTRHSEKPEVFYDRVRAASPEPRLDLFAREHREGFVVWGNEVTV